MLDCVPCEKYNTLSDDEKDMVREYVTDDLGLDMDRCLNNSITSDDVIDLYFDDDQRKYLDLMT